MPGTELVVPGNYKGCAATRVYAHAPTPPAQRQSYVPTRLLRHDRVCYYAMCGTDLSYAATRLARELAKSSRDIPRYLDYGSTGA
eukprot:93428-Rhodomonas_salina.4